MLEVERADGVVNAAFSRVKGLDRYSRSAPIGKAELAAIVLQGLAPDQRSPARARRIATMYVC